ncbi:MAG: sporulation protein [Oscillospiraceae bacterium]|nr:sporulation protein [Oscillospiraceae bacterium]
MRRNSASYYIVFFSIIVFLSGLVIFPRDVSESVRNALTLCSASVIPSLFPFFVASRLITNLRYSDMLGKKLNGVMRPVFSLDGTMSPALLLGLIGGYPVGAMTCATLYKERLCSRNDAERALAFCNNCGPAFIIGAVGNGVFASSKTGIALYIIHVLGALTTGFLLRILSPVKLSQSKAVLNSNPKIPSFSFSFTDSVVSAMKSSLVISAYIVLFSVLVKILQLLSVFSVIGRLMFLLTGIDESTVSAILTGLLEITVGSYSVSECVSFNAAFVIISFFLGLGGLSVHCQTLSAISDSGLSARQHFIGKAIHGCISALYAFCATNVFSFNAIPVFSEAHSYYFSPAPVFRFIFITLLIYIFCKKGWKKVK